MALLEELRRGLTEFLGDRLRIEATEYGKRGYHLDITVPGAELEAVASLANGLGLTLEALSGVDWPAEGVMELVYDFNGLTEGVRVAVRIRVPRENPEVPSLAKIFGGANWYEREAHDLFGIVFSGHPHLTPLILPEEATYHPLRKDFAP